MDSLCEEGGLHGPVKVCHSEVASPVVTAILTEEGDTTPAEFETARKDPVSIPDGRGPETTPKPGKSKGRKSRGLDISELIVFPFSGE